MRLWLLVCWWCKNEYRCCLSVLLLCWLFVFGVLFVFVVGCACFFLPFCIIIDCLSLVVWCLICCCWMLVVCFVVCVV